MGRAWAVAPHLVPGVLLKGERSHAGQQSSAEDDVAGPTASPTAPNPALSPQPRGHRPSHPSPGPAAS